jgi:hypothetical protein
MSRVNQARQVVGASSYRLSMARGQSSSGSGFAAVFLLMLAIGFVVTYIWWIVGAASLVGLFFVGRALVRHAEERRELAAAREEELTLRADRHMRWTLAGDSRAVYGPEGASATHTVSPPPALPPLNEDANDEPIAVAAMARTADELAALVKEKPSGWTWALFASVLAQRRNAVLPRLRDSELGFSPTSATYVYTGAELARILFGYVDEMLSTARQIDGFMAAPAFMATLNPGDQHGGDAEAIEHVANRLMDYHDRLLELSERCRSVSPPSYYADVVAECARVINRLLQGYRDFIAELVDVVEALPKFLRHADGDVHLGSLALDLDIEGVSHLTKRLDAISR